MSVTTARVAASAAVAATVLRILSIVTWPPDSDASHAKMLATAGAHPLAWGVATWAEVLCWVSAALAVLIAVWRVSGRGLWLTRVGGFGYGVSLLTLGIMGGAMNAVTAVLATQPNPPAMVRIIDDLHGAGTLAPFVAVVLLGELFAVPLALGLARARLVGWWYPVVTLLAILGYIVTSDSSDHLVVLAGFVPLGVTWVALARILTQHRVPVVNRGHASTSSTHRPDLTSTDDAVPVVG